RRLLCISGPCWMVAYGASVNIPIRLLGTRRLLHSAVTRTHWQALALLEETTRAKIRWFCPSRGAVESSKGPVGLWAIAPVPSRAVGDFSNHRRVLPTPHCSSIAEV